MEIVGIILVVCAAGFVQATAGFGFGLIAMAVLPLLLDYKEAAALVIPLSVVVTGVTFLRTRGHYDWRQGRELIAGALVGIPIGMYVLVRADEAVLRRLLGATMCAFAAAEWFRSGRRGGGGRETHVSAKLGFPLGVLSGGFDAAFNMGGPPAVAYVYARPWSREQTVASLQVLFGIGLMLRLILSAGAGLLSAHVLKIAAWCLIPLALCIVGATCLASRISRETLRRGVFIFVGAMGLKYLFFG